MKNKSVFFVTHTQKQKQRGKERRKGGKDGILYNSWRENDSKLKPRNKMNTCVGKKHTRKKKQKKTKRKKHTRERRKEGRREGRTQSVNLQSKCSRNFIREEEDCAVGKWVPPPWPLKL